MALKRFSDFYVHQEIENPEYLENPQYYCNYNNCIDYFFDFAVDTKIGINQPEQNTCCQYYEYNGE